MPLEIEFKHTVDITRKKQFCKSGLKLMLKHLEVLIFKVIKCTYSETWNLKGVSTWRSLKVKKLFLVGLVGLFACFFILLLCSVT